MSQRSFYKSSDLIILRSEREDELLLIQRGSKNSILLSRHASAFWRRWRGETVRDPADLAIIANLAREGMVFEDASLPPPLTRPCDREVPRLAGPHIRSYQEAPGFYVIFNTRTMQVFTLGEIASLCWEGILNGHTAGELREAVLRVFRKDVGFHLLKIFTENSILRTIDGLVTPDEEPDGLRRQFFIPSIPFWLPHARIPWSCDWELNTVCNLRCKHCYLPHHKGRGATTEALLDTCQQLIDLGTPFVTLLGGEVLLRSDLEQIIAKLSAANVFVNVVSNGTLMTPERARGLVDAGLGRLMLSLDGLDKDVHDACRGEGTFMQTLAAVKMLQAVGLSRLAIIWTTHSKNYFELPRLPAFLRAINVTECCIDRFKKTGKLGGRSDYSPLTREQIQAVKNTIAGWHLTDPDISVGFEPECTCGRTRLTIGADGNVRTCTFAPKASGNLRHSTLAEIWVANRDGYATTGPIGYCKAC